jgi:outer membrane protein TolC
MAGRRRGRRTPGHHPHSLAQADENLRVARDRYRNGVGTHTEVLDAEALRSLTDSNHLNAHYDLHLARLRLKKAVGEL